jgi:hypothetical protein
MAERRATRVLPEAQDLHSIILSAGNGTHCSKENCPPVGDERSQITRRRWPINSDTADLNKAVQQIFGHRHSVLQFYELIGTQYGAVGKSVDMNHVYPAVMRNSVIEPYTGCGLINSDREQASDLSCIGCHREAIVPPSQSETACTTSKYRLCSCSADCSFLLGSLIQAGEAH